MGAALHCGSSCSGVESVSSLEYIDWTPFNTRVHCNGWLMEVGLMVRMIRGG